MGLGNRPDLQGSQCECFGAALQQYLRSVACVTAALLDCHLISVECPLDHVFHASQVSCLCMPLPVVVKSLGVPVMSQSGFSAVLMPRDSCVDMQLGSHKMEDIMVDGLWGALCACV